MKTLEEIRESTGPASETIPVGPSGKSPWDRVVAALLKHYHAPDIEAARTLYSAVAAHGLNGQPVWPMAIAPPGSMKTELIRALDGLKHVHMIDGLTPKTFLSGQIRGENAGANASRQSSLLSRIGPSAIVLFADFSTLLSIKSDDRNVIFADLRRIYDGGLRKEFGTTEPVSEWKGRLTFVTAVTDAIDTKRAALQSLGDRFIYVRWPRSGMEAARKAMTQDMAKAREDVRDAVHSLFIGLTDAEPQVPDAIMTALVALAEFTARGRSHVPRDGKEVSGDPEPESPTRLAMQFCQLAKGSARLAARTSVDCADYNVARRSAFDCIPPRRRALLESCIRGDAAKVQTSTLSYDIADLQLLGLLEDGHLSEFGLDVVAQMDLTQSPPSAIEKIRDTRGIKGRFGEGRTAQEVRDGR